MVVPAVAGVCQLYGHTNILTLDEVHITGARSNCTHVLSETCGALGARTPFRITFENIVDPDNPGGAVVVEVHVEIYGHVVTLGQDNKILVRYDMYISPKTMGCKDATHCHKT